jgi:predicted RNA-binding Zn-ribbon protein involved in translation (DUF1610 family)
MNRRLEIKQGLLGRYTLSYDCPHCSSPLKSALDEAGTSQPCPDCGRGFTVPGKEERDRIRSEQERDAQVRREEKERAHRLKRDKQIELVAERKRIADDNRRRRIAAENYEQELAASKMNEICRCPYCGEEILAQAKKCKHCGEFLDGELRRRNAPRKWSPGVAAVLSFIIPGLGQMYKGQIGNGLVWMIVVIIGYVMMIIPGLILHLCCIAGAASGDPTE